MSNIFSARSRGPQFPQRRAVIRRAGGGNVPEYESLMGTNPDGSRYHTAASRAAKDRMYSGPEVIEIPDIIDLLDAKRPGYRRGGRTPGYDLGGLFGGSPGSSTTTQQSSTSVTNPFYNNLMNWTLGTGLEAVQNRMARGYQNYVGPHGETNPIVGLTPNQQRAISAATANFGNYSPFLTAANQTLNRTAQGQTTFPQAVQQYMSPYTQNVVQGIQDASNRNFEQNTMRTINDVFSGGNAASFGRERHGNALGNAVFAKTQADNNAVANALERGYATAGDLFNADQNRALQGGLGIATAQQGLGQATQMGAANDITQLLQTGATAQNTQQNQSNFDYNQWQAAQQYPFQLLQFAQGLGQGWQLPTQTNSTATSTVQQPSGSPFGQALGAGLGLASLAIPGAGGVSALGNILGGIRGWFSADGGYLTPDRQRPMAQGGMVPTIGSMRKKSGVKALQPTGGSGPPTGMPGMPPLPALAPMPMQGRQRQFADGGFTSDDMDEVPESTRIVSPPRMPDPPPMLMFPQAPSAASSSQGGESLSDLRSLFRILGDPGDIAGGGENAVGTEQGSPFNSFKDIFRIGAQVAPYIAMAGAKGGVVGDFADGGRVPRFDDGGSMFLDASEGLDDRLDHPRWATRSPFWGPGNETPKGWFERNLEWSPYLNTIRHDLDRFTEPLMNAVRRGDPIDIPIEALSLGFGTLDALSPMGVTSVPNKNAALKQMIRGVR